MAIRTFDIGARQGLRRAAATDVPNLMAIAGPNGAGKSNLLEGIRQRRHELQEDGTEVLYVGPHRTWRSSNVGRVAVYGFTVDSFMEVLKSDATPNFQYQIPGNLGMLQGVQRLAGSADDAQAYIKTAMIRLFDRQRALVTQRWEEHGGEVPPGSVPDLFQPFATLVETLLPHLKWVAVDDAQAENIRCLFSPASDPNTQFDIDDLSSGEKAAVALFLPFIEKQATALAAGIALEPFEVVPLTVLIDEPEIHLHPLLQLNVLEYMRGLANKNEAQFIFTCHSPTMLDALADDELWLLSPAALAYDNQLVRLTDSREHLEVARMITGSTHLLTRGKPIVFVEGEPDTGGSITDERLLRLLAPDTSHWAIVPTAEKHGVVQAVERLRNSELALPGQPVFGLVDSDRDDPARLPEYVVSWPVAMIENLLLSPEAIFEALRGFEMPTGLGSVEQVATSLGAIASARREEEIDLRVKAKLPVGRLTLSRGQLANAADAVKQQADAFVQRVEGLDIEALVDAATVEVDSIIDNDETLQRFHGKRILYEFYSANHIDDAGLSKPAFATKVALAVAGTARVEALAKAALDQIRLFFPPRLSELLRSATVPEGLAGERDALVEATERERAAWTSRSPTAPGREELRRRIFGLAVQISTDEQREALTLEASRIGTP